MMKKYLFLPASLLVTSLSVWAQPDNTKYPEPEFSKEVYFLKKDSVNTAIRLEKGSSKMESKTKMGGMGGSETGYSLEGEKSAVRLHSGNNLSFVFSTGASAGSSSSSSSAQRDSMMRANGMDPSTTQGDMGGMGGMNDPANTITLYKAESGKGKRKILMMKSPGASPFGSKKMKSSDKFTFSVKKIKEGYWELVIDKPLPKGEYAFSMMNMGASIDGSTTMFAFAIE
jgi:hypothetical protein